MRRPRLLAPVGFSHAIYHCVSRVVDRTKVLGREEKDQFTRYMRLYERLFGLRILTHCLMDNHFHILVEVPRRPEIPPTNEQLIELVRGTLGEDRANNLAHWITLWRNQGNFVAVEAERERWFRLMWNLAAFMKVLKQRFSQWYNGTRPSRRTGTLWEDRYRSMLVENGEALRAMAAYIDLNPVRAGLVSDPKDYRWSGYGEACLGLPAACAGLQWMAEQADLKSDVSRDISATPINQVMSWYREQLYGKGEETVNEEGIVVRRGFTEEEIQAVRDAGGQLPMTAYLRLRIRYFTDGAVFGTKAFVESVFEARRDLFSKRRRTGSRRLRKLESESPLRVARDLVVKAIG